ncbi:MAG: hypothetical protein M3069_20330 [Chloroflexota bacterium]|nr:hypothetical protein [Chloroflexota bacterium]
MIFAQAELRITAACHDFPMGWPPDEEMGDKQLRTVILRLVLDRWGALLHGEVADVEGRVISRVAGWDEVVASIKACVAGTKRMC